MKYTEKVTRELFALHGLEILEWRGKVSKMITYKKLKDSSIHQNLKPIDIINTIHHKYPEEFNRIVYGSSSPISFKSRSPCQTLKNFEVIEYNGCGHTNGVIKSKFTCHSCNTSFEHYYDKIKQSRHGCPHCGCCENMIKLPMEILKDCKPIMDPDVEPNTYWISDKGIVYTTIGRFKERKPVTQDSGHMAIGIGRDIMAKGERSSWKNKKLIHRLVLESFGFPQPSPLHIVRHKNDIPNDNRLDNLEWGLRVDNSKDMENNYKERQVAIKKLHSIGASISDLSVACKLSEDVINAMLL